MRTVSRGNFQSERPRHFRNVETRTIELREDQLAGVGNSSGGALKREGAWRKKARWLFVRPCICKPPCCYARTSETPGRKNIIQIRTRMTRSPQKNDYSSSSCIYTYKLPTSLSADHLEEHSLSFLRSPRASRAAKTPKTRARDSDKRCVH